MPTQVQRTASARRRLIAAATTLVGEQGVGNTSVAAIGERAGMSRGAVNFHFGSKDDLLTAVAAEVTAEWEARVMRHAVPAGAELADGLSVMVDGYRDDIASDPNGFRIFAMLFFESLGPSPHLHAHFARLHQHLRQRVVDILRQAQTDGLVREELDVEGYAAFVIGSLRGIAFQHLLDPQSFPLESAFSEARLSFAARLAP